MVRPSDDFGLPSAIARFGPDSHLRAELDGMGERPAYRRALALAGPDAA